MRVLPAVKLRHSVPRADRSSRRRVKRLIFAGLISWLSRAGTGAAVAAADPVPPPEACASSTLVLEEAYETVRVGGLALASDSVLGGPPECVLSASTDSPNVRVSLQKKGKVANVRIWALHEGFANVTVKDSNNVDIGVIRVSVYPREPHPHKGGK